jgi:GR25 family glycosyltransferase involved in LPS biosynthesis
MFRILLCASSLLCVSSYAKIEDHLKPVPNKTKPNQMKNIDFIYTINLDARPEKFAHCLSELKPYNIEPYRFSAVNGWELSFETMNDLAIKYEPWMNNSMMGTSYLPENEGSPSHSMVNVEGKPYFCHCFSRGAIGIVLSHLSILQDAYNSGYNTIWVMEDDIQVIQNPHLISELIDELDSLVGENGWDILFTDRDTKNQKGEYVPCTGFALRPNFSPKNPYRFALVEEIGPFRKIGARFGAYSMIVRRSGMEKLLNFIKTYSVFLPYDMEFYLPNNMKLFTVKDDVVSTLPNALSDNGRANYLKQQNSL